MEKVNKNDELGTRNDELMETFFRALREKSYRSS